MLYLLSISGYGEIVIPAIVGLIIWFFLLRTSVRADSIVKNQQLIIHILIQQYIKQGATEEDIQKLKQHIGIK